MKLSTRCAVNLIRKAPIDSGIEFTKREKKNGEHVLRRQNKLIF